MLLSLPIKRQISKGRDDCQKAGNWSCNVRFLAVETASRNAKASGTRLEGAAIFLVAQNSTSPVRFWNTIVEAPLACASKKLASMLHFT
ncbi:Arabinanase/levansucrase/invertase [Sesbania bispinosa]|nr:Arabinanase/levansucrase/invertase [Sesbania bispinosa]